MKLDLSSILKPELTPEQIEAAVKAEEAEARRPKGTVCGTIKASDNTSK